MTNRLRVLVALVALLVVSAAGAADVELLENGRTFVRWSEWRGERGELALLVWASWAPTADEVLEHLVAIERAASARGLSLVVVDVQEPVEAARAALGDRGVAWLHDRHGALLKELRVIRVPALVVLDAEGRVNERLEATAEALGSKGAP